MFIGNREREFKNDRSTVEDYLEKAVPLNEFHLKVEPVVYAVSVIGTASSLLMILLMLIYGKLRQNEYRSIFYLQINNLFLCAGFLIGFPYLPDKRRLCFV